MSRQNISDLPAPLQRDFVTYAENYVEWKNISNKMERIDKALKKYMADNKVDYLDSDKCELIMTHPMRLMLDQSLIEDIDQYKVRKPINLCTVNMK